MTLQFSDAIRNARADQCESVVGTSPIMQIRSGSPPANCAAASSGVVLASLTLPSDWMNAASSGSKTKNGTWQDASADATGTAGHFRIFDSTGTTCHHQGTCSATGGGGDMILSTTSLVAGQPFTVNTYTINEGNG